jgi:hypothetical protein
MIADWTDIFDLDEAQKGSHIVDTEAFLQQSLKQKERPIRNHFIGFRL